MTLACDGRARDAHVRRRAGSLVPALVLAGAAASETRLASIRKRLQGPAAAIDEDLIKSALRSKDSERHPICRPFRPGAGSFTFGATIMTLSGTPSLQVSAGPPDVNPFVRLECSGGQAGSKRSLPPRGTR